MKSTLIIIFLLLVPLVSAETTFFDQDDVFVMGNPPTTPTADSGVTGETGGTTGGRGCRYEWNCTNWSECLPSGKQTRNCTNIGTCPDRYKPPEIEQNCTYVAPEIEEEKEGEKEEAEKLEKEEGEKEEIADRDKTPNYFVISLVILYIILYFKRDYLRKLILKIKI